MGLAFSNFCRVYSSSRHSLGRRNHTQDTRKSLARSQSLRPGVAWKRPISWVQRWSIFYLPGWVHKSGMFFVHVRARITLVPGWVHKSGMFFVHVRARIMLVQQM